MVFNATFNNISVISCLSVLLMEKTELSRKGGGGYGFLFHSEIFFRTTQELEYLSFFRAKRKFFFKNLTLGYMTKTLNQIIFFFLHQNQNIFFSNIGNQNIYLEKNHNPPPLQVKWSFPYKVAGKKIQKGYVVYVVCLSDTGSSCHVTVMGSLIVLVNKRAD